MSNNEQNIQQWINIWKSAKHRNNESDITIELHTNIANEEPGLSQDINIAEQFNQSRTSENGVNTATIENCTSRSDIIDFLKDFECNDIHLKPCNILLLKFVFIDIISTLDRNDLKIISEKCANKSLIVLLMSKTEKDFEIYWKLKTMQKLLMLKLDRKLHSNEMEELMDFVIKFLVESLKHNHSGLITTHPLQNRIITLDLLAYSQNFNMLLLATESGNKSIVEILLKFNLITRTLDNDVDAKVLAIENGHFEIFYSFLQANMTYPDNFDKNICSGKLKEFCKDSEELHKLIMSNEKIVSLLFYITLKTALLSHSFDTFDILLSRKFHFGPHEDPAECYKGLSDDDKRTVRNIQNKYSQNFVDKYIHRLVENSTACFDETKVEDKRILVERAFKLLSENYIIRILLMIVAASKNFTIFFDFSRDAVNVVDPTSDRHTQGVFYITGKIYIGAKQLLEQTTEHETLAVLAHELCHFTMGLVFDNSANPYKKNDNQTIQEFEEISKICRESHGIEEIIDIVYDCYPTDMIHAELIVRVVHLIVLYKNDSEKIAELRNKFSKLFDFYENKIVPELQKALPEIEKKYEKALHKKNRKISKLKKLAIACSFFGIFGIMGSIYFGIHFQGLNQSFEDLDETNRDMIIKSKVLYKNEIIKMQDLFQNNFTVYKLILPTYISKMLNHETLDLNDPNLSYLKGHIVHSWENLTVKLKTKFLHSNFTFQGHRIKFDDLNHVCPGVFKFFTSEQIISVLDGINVQIYNTTTKIPKFYVERKFRDDNTSIQIANFDELLFKVQNSRIFILSADPGIGKTTIFKYISWKLKNIFPLQWISYIDLIKHTNLLSNRNYQLDALDFMEEVLDIDMKNKFETEIFRNLYKNGSAVFLWNGYDEISSEHRSFLLNVLVSIKNHTKNIQFICTTPAYSNQLKSILKTTSNSVVPFNKSQQDEFLTKFFNTQNISDKNVTVLRGKIQKIKHFTNTTDIFDNPFILLKIANYFLNKGETSNITSLYSIYEAIIEERINIWRKESLFGKKLLENTQTKYRKFDLMEFYQNYALRSELSLNDSFINLTILSVFHQKVPDELTFNEISLMGIMNINSNENFKFAHSTFAEFFVAQFYIDYQKCVLSHQCKEEIESVNEIFRRIKLNKRYDKFIDSFEISNHDEH